MKWPESPKLSGARPVLGSLCHWTKDTGSEHLHASILGTLMQTKRPKKRSPQAQVPVLAISTIPFLS